MKRVLLLRSKPVNPDPRVERAALALWEGGYRVRVLAWDRWGEGPREEERAFGLQENYLRRAPFGTGLRNLPRLLGFQAFLLAYLWKRRREYDVVHACDFDTVFPALWAKLFLGKRVVYDVFDYYADTIRNIPEWLRGFLRAADALALSLADGVILADEERRAQIGKAQPKRTVAIYNVPHLEVEPLFLPKPPLRIAYIGHLQFERGLLPLLEVLRAHPEWELHLGGFGGDEGEILAKAQGMPNVIFYGKVPFERAMEINAQSHVLLATYDPAIPNHRYSSPNKLFEAMALGKPILVAEGTGIDRLVREEGLGFAVRYGHLGDLEEALARVASWTEAEERAFAARARGLFRERFAWERMRQALLDFYREVVGG